MGINNTGDSLEALPNELQGKVALITGGSRGIGQAIAIELARLGAAVVVNYRENASAAQSVVETIRTTGGRAVAIRADVSRSSEAQRLAEEVLITFDRIDILINNAAMHRVALVHKMSDVEWREVLDTNLSAVFYLCRALLPAMFAAKRGHIVNIASPSSFMGQQGAASYVASKHGLIGLTRTLALETASHGILVNAVAPGLTATDLIEGLTDAQRNALLSITPLKRLAVPAEVAAMVAFLVTRATYSTGNVFHVGGGVVM
jgi:NAD(P)-dependent dehydrogenase (short-subunit alcohol dehydrogenase family)